jgi:hypothetical protein
MRGLALHEIGHNLCDFGRRGFRTTDGIAKSEGIGEIYDFLLDERLERILRARRPEWGVYFDRLTSYAFVQRQILLPLAEYAAVLELDAAPTRRGIAAGTLAGSMHDDNTVRLNEIDMLRIPGLYSPHMAFLCCLRCGFDPHVCADPRIARAVACVPANLKDMDHGALLDVARAVALVLGRSPDFRESLKQMQQRLQASHELSRIWDKMMDGAGDVNQLPDWMRKQMEQRSQERNIIRRNPPRGARRQRNRGGRGQTLNLSRELAFPPLEHEVSFDFDPVGHAALVGRIRKHVRRLRGYFERLGMRTTDVYGSSRGHRVDLGRIRNMVIKPDARMLVHAEDMPSPNAYVGILIDTSASMHGHKVEVARSFAALAAESLKGLRGIGGHVNGFDDSAFVEMGAFERPALTTWEPGGGNNDAAALERAANQALATTYRNRLLIMISDGSPSSCSVDALRAMVATLTREHRIVCVQVAVESMDHIAFPEFVDLSALSTEEAVARFGNLLIRLTSSWR